MVDNRKVFAKIYHSAIFGSSRSYKIPGSDISLGALKAYPMSPFLTTTEVGRIIKEVGQSIEEYRDKFDESNYAHKKYISDEMVYREHKKKEAS